MLMLSLFHCWLRISWHLERLSIVYLSLLCTFFSWHWVTACPLFKAVIESWQQLIAKQAMTQLVTELQSSASEDPDDLEDDAQSGGLGGGGFVIILGRFGGGVGANLPLLRGGIAQYFSLQDAFFGPPPDNYYTVPNAIQCAHKDCKKTNMVSIQRLLYLVNARSICAREGQRNFRSKAVHSSVVKQSRWFMALLSILRSLSLISHTYYPIPKWRTTLVGVRDELH